MHFGLMFFAASEDALSDNKYALVIESAKFGDQYGFSSVWVPERHFTALGSLYPNPAVLHAAVARETRQIQLRAGSVVLPLHHPIRVAEEWSVVDNLSGGRVGISFASGWNPNDFAFFPERYQSRQAEMLAAIQTVRRLWRGEPIEITSGKGEAVAVRVYPTPVQPELPVWVTAAGNPQTFAAAGALGAHLLTHVLDQSIETLAERVALYRQARAEHGHDPAAGIVTVMIHTFVGSDAEAVREQARAPYCQYLKSNIGLLKGLAQSRGQSFDITTMAADEIDAFVNLLYDRFATSRGLIGTPDTCLDVVRQLAEAGVDEIACLLDFGPPVDVILQNLPYLQQLKQRCETELAQPVAGTSRRSVAAVAAPDPRRQEVLAEIQLRCTHEIPTDRFYDDLRRHGVQMGAAFQGIERLWQHEWEALGLIQLPELLSSSAPAYMLHPALLDACFQVFVAALPPSIVSGGETLYVPSGLRSLRTHGGIGQRVWSYAALRSPADRGDAAFEGDVLIFDEAGKLLVEVDGLRLQHMEAPAAASAQPFSAWLYDIRWHVQAVPDAPPIAQRPGRWIVFADRHGVSSALIDRLRQQGESCLVVLPGASTAYIDRDMAEVEPCNAQAMHQFLQAALASGPDSCRGIIHAWSLDATPPEAAAVASLERDQDHGVISALHLIQALREPGPATYRLWLVTRGAQAIGASRALPAVAQSPLWGLGRTVPLELPQLAIGLIDLDPDEPADGAAGQLFNAVWRPDHEDQIAFRAGQRLVARLERDRTFKPDQRTLAIRPDATYVITGGLGNLGLHFARWLVERGGRHLALLGRSEPSAAARAALHDLELRGARLHIFQADVADPVAMAAVFDELRTSEPPVRGIIHAAGVTSYQLLEALDAATCRQMLRPKVVGTWVLYELCQDIELDFFACISSLSPVWGTKGLGHYAAANHFLDIFGHYARRRNLPVTTINLGPIAGGGMAAATMAIQAAMTQGGLRLLPPAVALDATAAVISAGTAQKIIVDVDWATFRQLHEMSGQRPLLELVGRDEIAADQRDLLTPSAFLQSLAQAPSSAREELLFAHIGDQVSHVLKLDAARRPYPQQGFFDMGMDSLMVLDLKNRLQKSLGYSLPTTLLFEHATIEALTTYLLTHLFTSDTPSAPAAPSDVARQPDDLTSITTLTEDELRRLIDSELERLIDD